MEIIKLNKKTEENNRRNRLPSPAFSWALAEEQLACVCRVVVGNQGLCREQPCSPSTDQASSCAAQRLWHNPSQT